MSARPKTPTHADEKQAILYGHPIPENSFAVRDLVHKLPGVGLFDLRRTEDGAHACTFCGACQKACPVDCIDVRRDPLALARQGQGAPLRRHDHPGRAALHDLQPLHGDLQVRRARAHRAVLGAPPPRAGAGEQDAAALQRPRPLQRLRRLDRREPGAEPGEEPLRRLRAPPAASRCRRRATPTPPGRAATSTPTSRTPRRRSPASRPRSAPCASAASSRTGSSSSPSAATAAPTTSACRRSPAPWSAATTCSTCATTTAPT